MYLAPLFLLPALATAIPLESNPVKNLGLRSLGVSPGDITIASATASGNGCPQNSFSTTISDDREVSSTSTYQAVLLPFPQFCGRKILVFLTTTYSKCIEFSKADNHGSVGCDIWFRFIPSLHWPDRCTSR
jgi:hypothetical protein